MIKIFKLSIFAVFALSLFALAQPAQAFYLEVPRAMRNLLQSLQTSRSSAQEATVISPTQTTVTQNTVTVQQPTVTQVSPMPINTQPAPMPTQPAPMPTSETSSREPGPTCRVNGVEMPGSCDQYNNRSDGGQPSMSGPNQMGPEDDQRNNERFLRDMKRGARDMGNQLRRLERMFGRGAVPEVVRQKIENARSIINAMNSAQSAEEMQNIDMDMLQADMQELEEQRQGMERLQNMKRELRNVEQGLRMFKQQFRRLANQRIAVPADINAKVTELETAINTIKSATAWEDAEEAMETMREKMESLDESRQQLEMISRWPQTKREMDRIVRDLNRALTRAKSTAARLSRTGVDVSAAISRFEEKFNRLKSVKEEVGAAVQSGSLEDVFDRVGSDFFEQVDDVWQEMRIIETMSRLGRFSADFRRGIADAQRQIRALQRRRIDVAELRELLSQAQSKGNEVIAALRAGLNEGDDEIIMAQLEELEGLKAQFEDKANELTGEGQRMPWESGPRQFQQIRVSDNLGRMMNEATRAKESRNAPAESAAGETESGGGEQVSESNPSPAP